MDRRRLQHELPQRLTTAHRQFLSGLVRAEPDWSLLQCSHSAELPALRWKLSNLETSENVVLQILPPRLMRWMPD